VNKSIVTPEAMQAAYEFLRKVSFKGLKLPPSKKVTFQSKRLKKYHGLYEYPEHILTINSDTKSVTGMLQIMAHEMIHVAYEQNGKSDHDKHDEHFEALARIIEGEMGWPKGSV